MKLSVSLPAADIDVLDEHVRRRGLPSRSAALRDAIRMLREPELEQAYEAAWLEWESSEARALWEGTSADGT